MIEKITLRVFWTFMILCAGTVLSIIWFPVNEDAAEIPIRIQFAMTFFVIGLASALVWLPLVVYRFYRKSTN
jgi:dipeptide/tripeptide permease